MEDSSKFTQGDWSLLTTLPEELTIRLFHNVMDTMCGWQAEDNTIYTKEPNSLEWKHLITSLENHLLAAIKNDWTEEQFLQSLEESDSRLGNDLYTCLLARKEELHKHIKEKSSCNYELSLVDFDWKMKLIMGSDKISSIKELIVTLDLETEGKEKNSIISTELNKEELHKLILALESCHKAAAQLKI